MLVFLQIICLGYSPLRPKTRKLKPKFDNFPVFRFCPIFYMLFIDIKSQLFRKTYFCCNFLKLNLYYDWTNSARLSATGGNRANTLVSHVTGYESDKAFMGLSRTKSERTYPEVSKHSGIRD